MEFIGLIVIIWLVIYKLPGGSASSGSGSSSNFKGGLNDYEKYELFGKIRNRKRWEYGIF